MPNSVRDAYLQSIDPARRQDVIALDEAIRSAYPSLEVAIKYRLLTYGLDDDWRTWVCAIDARPKGITLRFLYGVLLDDPLGVLRKGSSVLCNWDLPAGAAIDLAAVASYVREAGDKKAHYVARQDEIQQASREQGTRKPRAR